MKKICLLLVLALALALSGCAAAEEKTVMASFYPVYILARNVLENVPDVTLLCMTAPTTGCLHDYQLLTSDMRALAGASAFIINGAGMESFLPDVQAQLPELPVIDCSQSIELIAEEEHEEEEHEEEHEEHEEHHHHGAYNAHIWLAPRNAVQMVRNIAEGLSALFPEHQRQLTENAEAYIAKLEALDAELSAAIGALPNKTIVTFHEAFPYFAQAYGLNVAAVAALEPDEPVSPKMLAELTETVRLNGNPPLFSEPQYENAALMAVHQETGAPVYELDPLVTGDGSLTAYEDVQRNNLKVLVEALQ